MPAKYKRREPAGETWDQNETDKINHPERPLITGEISILEAKIFSLFEF